MTHPPSASRPRNEYRKRFALLSGGTHSLVATHYAVEEDSVDEVIHIRTKIGVKECEEFVRDTCASQKFRWKLRVVEPPEMQFEDLVMKYGFPGPGMHYLYYRMLKERAIRVLVRESKHRMRDEIALISGVHQQESARRMGFVAPLVKVGAQIWLAPLFNYNAIDFADYNRKYSLPVSPVKAKLGFSGECLCGAFAQPNEIAKLEKFYPETAARIHDLEGKAKAAGKHCVWGTRPPKKKKLDQYEIPFMPMCSSCPTRSQP
jgi:3'-phosphoadenosine 5'-phosphosulfate sulfotransferase (PAPS reductase)/FAD synthetase